jgi:hypothetical protein
MEISECTGVGRPYVLAYNEASKRGKLYQPRCKRWSCDYCALQNCLYWCARGASGAQRFVDEGQVVNFVTITSRPGLNPGHSILRFRKSWPKMRKRLVYHNGGKFEYLLIPERHKSGVLHAHFMANLPIALSKIKDMAYLSGLGYISDLEAVFDARGAIFYVTKYLTKNLDDPAWPTGFHRVRVSKKWPKYEGEELPPGYQYIVLHSFDQVWLEVSALRHSGYTIKIALSATSMSDEALQRLAV